MIKLTAVFMAIFIALFSAVFYYYSGPFSAVSCIAGGAIVLLSLGGFYFSMKLIISKKSIALGILLIIFKYLLLGLVLIGLSKAGWLEPIGFVVGLSTLLLAILSMTVARRFVTKT